MPCWHLLLRHARQCGGPFTPRCRTPTMTGSGRNRAWMATGGCSPRRLVDGSVHRASPRLPRAPRRRVAGPEPGRSGRGGREHLGARVTCLRLACRGLLLRARVRVGGVRIGVGQRGGLATERRRLALTTLTGCAERMGWRRRGGAQCYLGARRTWCRRRQQSNLGVPLDRSAIASLF